MAIAMPLLSLEVWAKIDRTPMAVGRFTRTLLLTVLKDEAEYVVRITRQPLVTSGPNDETLVYSLMYRLRDT